MRDDWHRAYIMKLGKLGLDIPPDMFERARERIVNGIHHRHAILAFAAWPLSFWRFDPLDERDFEWFERHYPGWYVEYGAFWEAFRQGIDPGAGFLPLDFINMAPPFCWTCQGPVRVRGRPPSPGGRRSAPASTARRSASGWTSQTPAATSGTATTWIATTAGRPRR